QRAAPSPIRQQPEPEIETLARSPHCAPRAAERREIQDDDRVGSLEPDFEGIVGSQVTVQDPPVLTGERPLDLDPLFAPDRHEAGAPEEAVQFDDGQAGDPPQERGERRLPRTPGTEDQDASHGPGVTPAPPGRAFLDPRRPTLIS